MENPIFRYSSEFVSDDDSNFLDEYAGALIAIKNYYCNNLVTTASVALLQVTVFEYLFIVDTHEGNFDVLKVTMDNYGVELVTQFNKLMNLDEQE